MLFHITQISDGRVMVTPYVDDGDPEDTETLAAVAEHGLIVDASE